MSEKRYLPGADLRLQTVLTTGLALIAIVVVFLSSALIAVASHSSQIMTDLGVAIEGVHVAESLEGALLLHSRASDGLPSDPEARVGVDAAERRIRERLERLRVYGGGSAEDRLIAVVDSRVRSYLAVHRAAERAERIPEAVAAVRTQLDMALLSLKPLVGLNIRQAGESKAMAEVWGRTVSTGGMTAALLISAGVTGLLAWLWRGALRPMLGLAAAIERFAAGERSARAPVIGPGEMRGIAQRFNSMAECLQRERENQLAYLSCVAHDLRTPLATLKMSAQLLERGPRTGVSPELHAGIGRILRQVDGLDRMVGDLLDAMRIEAGELELRVEPCDPCQIAREVVDLYAAEDGSRVALRHPQATPQVRCDPLRLAQVLHNLLSNAIKYSEPSSPIEVSIAAQGSEVLLAVTDRGIGIDPKDLGHIFEPFRRTETARSQARGVGLGLSVSRRIVYAHGGRIEVDSTPGRGSTFRIRMPCIPDRPRRPARGARRPESAPGSEHAKPW